MGVALTVAAATLLAAGGWPAEAVGARERDEVDHVVDHVVVVGVAGLRWEDVGWRTTPNLARVVDAGSVGTLSVRSAPTVTCPAEGWLTLGAGTYAARRDPAAIDPDDGCGARLVPRVEPSGTGARVPDLPRIVELNRRLRFDARPGWLADQVGCVGAVGDGAALAAATATGAVARYAAELPRDLRTFAETCPVTLIDAGSLPERPEPPERPNRLALRRFDDVVGRVRSRLPRDTVLVVAGLAETDTRQARLHVAAAIGPGFGPGWLDSPSTRRVPYVQLSDIAPTILAALRRPFPDEAAGRPLVGAAPGRPETLAGIRARLADTDRRAVEQRRVLAPFFAGFGAMAAAVVVGLAALLAKAGPARRRRASSSRLVRAVQAAAIGLAGAPAATFLANTVPWWRSPLPLIALAGAVVVAAAALLGAALLVGALVSPRRRARAQAVTVAGLTVATFAVDAVTGSGLQMDSLLGYNPLVAGRFTGIGNIAFAVLGAAAITLAALVATGRDRAQAVVTVAAVAVPVVALDGSPAWGADFGGVLALVPAFVVLGMLAAEVRVTWGRLVVAGVAAAAVVGLVSWLDYLRPERSHSHFGRFVQSVLDGRASDTIGRKLANSWELMLMGPHTIAALGLAVVLALVVLRPPPVLRRACAAQAGLGPMLHASLALAVVGFALNDSGVAIPAVMSLVTVPLALALCADELRTGHRAGHA